MVNIADNGIGNKGLKIISSAKFLSLTYLNLENNNLTNKSLKSLKLILDKDSPLMDLRLGRNSLEDPCILEIAASLF
jgi:Leucine Rich repeat